MNARKEKLMARQIADQFDDIERLERALAREEARALLAEQALAESREMATEYEVSFDLRWKADTRARERWQIAHPDRPLTWPDHADMVIWLSEQWDKEQETVRVMFEKAYDQNFEKAYDQNFEGYRELGELAAAEANKAAFYKVALLKIRNDYGQVCAEFESCKHASCQASVSAWLEADRALNPEQYDDERRDPSAPGDEESPD